MMDNDKKMVPRIRFRGFEGDWEQRKVQDLSKRNFGGGTPKTSTPAYWHGNIPWIQSSNVQTGKVSLKKTDVRKYLSTRAIQDTPAGIIPKDSIAVVTRVGVGKLAIVPFNYATSQDFISFSNLTNDKLFTVYLLSRLLSKEADKVQGTSIKGITKKYLLGAKIKIPNNKVEQMNIGRTLNLIDNLIVASEKKIQQLKKLKALLLQKLFDQDWRFEGFKDPWEQRKLNEIAIINPSESLPSRFNYIDLDAVNHGKITNRKKIYLSEAPSRAQRVAHTKDVFFQNVRPYQRNNVIYYDDSLPTVFSSGYTQIRTKIDSEFMISALESDSFLRNVLVHSTGSNYPAISSKQLGDLKLSVPGEEESVNIGNLFKMLKNLIVANEKKLDQLKQLKKYLMQNMFV